MDQKLQSDIYKKYTIKLNCKKSSHNSTIREENTTNLNELILKNGKIKALKIQIKYFQQRKLITLRDRECGQVMHFVE